MGDDAAVVTTEDVNWLVAHLQQPSLSASQSGPDAA